MRTFSIESLKGGDKKLDVDVKIILKQISGK
jgi:hypothetical protein